MQRGGSDRRLLFLVGITALAAYLALEQGRLVSWDGRAIASVALNLRTRGSLKECCVAFHAFPKDPGPYSVFGIGLSVLLAPLWLLQPYSHKAFAVSWPTITWLGLANPLVLALATVVIAKTGLLLGWRRSSAVLTALAFALLTMAPFYSAELFPEPGVALGVAVVLLGFVTWQHDLRRGALLVGCGISVAVLFRPDSVVLVAPVVVLLPLFRRLREMIGTWRTWLFPLAAPLFALLVWSLYYNWVRFGELFQFGSNSVYDQRGFSTPLFSGVSLLLWSPGLSFFVYAPILLAAIPGIALLAKRRLPLATVVVVLCVGRLVFYAKWWGPWGGDAWGPRFLMPLCAVLAIPLGETFEQIHRLRAPARRFAIAVIGALASLSVAVQVATFSVFYLAVYQEMRSTKNVPLALQQSVVHARSHRFFWTFGDNHVFWNLRHIGSDHWFALEWFHNGPTLFGLAMVVFAVAAFISAMRIAVHADRDSVGA